VNDSKFARGGHHNDYSTLVVLDPTGKSDDILESDVKRTDMRLTHRPCSQEPLADPAPIDWVLPQCTEAC
jgi:hypothetical protein